jgi:predicted ATPase/DNA-binding SARP family transcriptional activator
MADRSEQGQDDLSIRLLGGFQVTLRKRTLDDAEWASRKAASLVKLLALAPGHRLHREQAMDALWPDLGHDAARSNLRKALHFARHTLDPSATPATHPYLQARGDLVLLASPRGLWIDVDAFKEAVSAARSAPGSDTYRRATALYIGDLLPEDLYEEWAITARDELRNTYLLLLAEAARYYEASGDLNAGIESLRRSLDLEPLNEDTYAGLMRLHALRGEQDLALRMYRQLHDALCRELDIEPREATQRLHREIESGRFPPAGKVEPIARSPRRRHNLPTQLTSFVGRRHEMAEVERLLISARLLTLTGAGGSGKTRLALEGASGQLGNYPDGVWFVELAGLSDAALVPQAVASALGMRVEPGHPPLDTLSEYLQARRLLFVLDNCEHLIGACAELSEKLLHACPGLKILATSREALNIRGETTWLVPPLSLPDPHDIASPGEALLSNPARYESLQLFAERAVSASPSFKLDSHNAATVAQICHRLDGIPLAIELAAARVRVLSADQIAERLDDSFLLLTGGSRTDLPRHQTLRAAVDWSYDLLTAMERALFARLSVFAGGFTLDAAEAVCAGDPIEQHVILDELSHLVDKSLVVVTAPGRGPDTREPGRVRYRLLETLRQYGRERLAERGEDADLLGRHAHYYASLCATSEPKLSGRDQVEWMDRLNDEIDNLRAALDWCRAHDPQSGMLLAGSSMRMWEAKGYLTEGRRWLDSLLALGPSRTILRAKALHAAGNFASRDGENALAARLLEESLAIYTEVGDQVGIALVLERLGVATQALGDSDLGLSYLERSISLLRQIGYKGGLGWALGSMGMHARIVGDYDRAREALSEGLELTRESGDWHAAGYTMNHLGQLARVQGDYDTAYRLIDECLELSRKLDSKPLMCWTLESLATVVRMRGDYDKSRELLVEGLEVAREVGMHRTVIACMYSLGIVAVHYGSIADAVRLFAASVSLDPEFREILDADEIVEWDEALETAQKALGSDAFAQAWAESETMTWDQASNLALQVAPKTPGVSIIK